MDLAELINRAIDDYPEPGEMIAFDENMKVGKLMREVSMLRINPGPKKEKDRSFAERLDDLEAQVFAMRRVREEYERQPRLVSRPIMTPIELEVLLHFSDSPTAHPRMDAPVVAHAVRIFVQNGILEPAIDGVRYFMTKKGKHLIERLCSVPWPDD